MESSGRREPEGDAVDSSGLTNVDKLVEMGFGLRAERDREVLSGDAVVD